MNDSLDVEIPWIHNMGVSKNSGTPKSSILIGVSIINHPFWGTPIFGNIHMDFVYLHHFSISKWLLAGDEGRFDDVRRWLEPHRHP